MLVSCLKLRIRDLELSPEEVLRTQPLVGRLSFTANPYQGRDGQGRQRCLLMPLDKDKTEPLVQLHSATLTIDHRGIRIEGKEDEWRRKDRTTYDQVLWCRPLGSATVNAR